MTDTTELAPLPCLAPQELSFKHSEELRASTITAETAKLAGLYTENRPDQLCMLLNRSEHSKHRKCAPAIVFPHFGIDGAKLEAVQVKPDNPIKRDGKPVKYESPLGCRSRVYLAPGTREKLKQPFGECFITEGCKKALALDQHGLVVFGLWGVDCGLGKGSCELHPDFKQFTWKDVCVYIVFDSDAADKSEVKNAESKLAQAFEAAGAKVKIVRLPPGAEGADGKPAKVGVDDYLLAHSVDDLRTLVTEAQDPEPPDAGIEKCQASDLDPHDAIRRYLAEKQWHKDEFGETARLRYYCSEFWVWSVGNGCFNKISDEVVKSVLTKWLDKFACHISTKVIANLMAALKAQIIVSERYEMPCWLIPDDQPPFPAKELLPTKSGMVHLPSYIDGRKYLCPLTPFFFSCNCLDFAFDADAPEPAEWLKFLKLLWPADVDADSIETLQMWFGYGLTPETRMQKILMLIGPQRSGKGTIARVQRQLIGERNTGGPTLSTFGDRFGLESLVGKLLAIISDARLSGKSDQAPIVENLLRISGEDFLTIDRKHKAALNMILACKIMILSNELPRLTDASGALADRLIILSMIESFLGREDIDLKDKLEIELPGILLWAIRGWQKLRQARRFTQPGMGCEAAAQMKDLASPVSAFVRENWQVKEGLQVERKVLYGAWQAWCEQNGRSPGDSDSFGRMLRSAFPSIGRSQPRDKAGSRNNCYSGIGQTGSRSNPGESGQNSAPAQVPDDLAQGAGTTENPVKTGVAQLAQPIFQFNKNGNEEKEKSSTVEQKQLRKEECNGAAHVPVVPNLPEFTFTASTPGHLEHKRRDCQSTTGWHHIHGDSICFECWPPTDLTAVAKEATV